MVRRVQSKVVASTVVWGLLLAAEPASADEPAPFSDARLAERVRVLVPLVEKAIGVSLGKPPRAVLVDRPEFERLAIKQLRELWDGIEGLPPGFLRDQSARSARIIAQVRPAMVAIDTGTIHVCMENVESWLRVDGADCVKLQELVDALLIHELTHVHQLRALNLRKFLGGGASFEEAYARQAISEGHAEYVAWKIAKELGYEKTAEFFREHMEGGATAGRFEAYGHAMNTFPYVEGAAFVREIVERRGYAEAIRTLFRSPPTHVWEIDNPSMFGNKEKGRAALALSRVATQLNTTLARYGTPTGSQPLPRRSVRALLVPSGDASAQLEGTSFQAGYVVTALYATPVGSLARRVTVALCGSADAANGLAAAAVRTASLATSSCTKTTVDGHEATLLMSGAAAGGPRAYVFVLPLGNVVIRVMCEGTAADRLDAVRIAQTAVALVKVNQVDADGAERAADEIPWENAWFALALSDWTAADKLRLAGEMVKAKQPLVRAEAARVLLITGDPGITKHLKVLGSDDDPGVRRIFVRNYGVDGPQRREAILAGLGDDDALVRRAAVLRFVSEDSVFPEGWSRLKECALNDKDDLVRYIGMRALSKLSRRDAVAVLRLMAVDEGRGRADRLMAIREIGALGPAAKEAVDDLRKLAEDATYRAAALDALARVDAG